MVKSKPSSLEQDPPINFVFHGVEAVENLAYVISCFVIQLLLYVTYVVLFLQHVFISDHKLVEEVYCSALADEEVCLVKYTCDPIHLNHMLDVVLLTKSRQCYVKFFVLVKPRLAVRHLDTTSLEAAATVGHDVRVEAPGPVVYIEFEPGVDTVSEGVVGSFLTDSNVDVVVVASHTVQVPRHSLTLAECMVARK